MKVLMSHVTALLHCGISSFAMLHTIHRFFLLIAVQRAASQSAEPSQWDAVIANCSAAAPAGSAHSSITQDSTTTATVAFTGFTPTMMWLANQDGTVVAFSDAVPTTGGTIALTWPASVQGDLPLDLHAHSCPPPATYTLPIRAWRGRYEDVLAMCCATMPPTAAQVTAYSPTITVDWNSQRIRVQAATKAPLLNYAKDSTGMVIRIDETGTGAYAPPLIPFTPLATSVMACALLSADEINPICVETSLVDHIVADLEAGATNPATRADLIAFGANGARRLFKLARPAALHALHPSTQSTPTRMPSLSLPNGGSDLLRLVRLPGRHLRGDTWRTVRDIRAQRLDDQRRRRLLQLVLPLCRSQPNDRFHDTLRVLRSHPCIDQPENPLSSRGSLRNDPRRGGREEHRHDRDRRPPAAPRRRRAELLCHNRGAVRRLLLGRYGYSQLDWPELHVCGGGDSIRPPRVVVRRHARADHDGHRRAARLPLRRPVCGRPRRPVRLLSHAGLQEEAGGQIARRAVGGLLPGGRADAWRRMM